MYDSDWGAGRTMFVAILLAAIAGIAVYLVRAFRRQDKKPWPALFVGVYNIALLLMSIFGVATQVTSEGFGFLPLMVLTTPWSWLVVWLWKSTDVLDSGPLGNSNAGAFLFYTGVFILPWVANSCILYFLVRRHQKQAAEDKAWEHARRNR